VQYVVKNARTSAVISLGRILIQSGKAFA